MARIPTADAMCSGPVLAATNVSQDEIKAINCGRESFPLTSMICSSN